ncbi:MAG: hypothetical protein ACI89X_005161 [Planctomycetota bacterium]|jgi:hypothetical protein
MLNYAQGRIAASTIGAQFRPRARQSPAHMTVTTYAALHRNLAAPPQRGHVSTSIANTRRNSSAHVVVAPHSATPTGTMRHPRYRLRNRPRANLVRPRFLRIRAAVVERFLFGIPIDLRNDPMPQTRTWRQHPTCPSAAAWQPHAVAHAAHQQGNIRSVTCACSHHSTAPRPGSCEYTPSNQITWK